MLERRGNGLRHGKVKWSQSKISSYGKGVVERNICLVVVCLVRLGSLHTRCEHFFQAVLV